MPAPTGSFDLSVSLGEASFSASGKPDLVLKAFEDFKALTGHADVAQQASAGRRTTSAKRASSASPPSGDLSLPAFLARLKIKGGAQVGTAIIAWSAQYDGKDRLTPKEVEVLWKRTKYKVPSTVGNLTRDLNKAVKAGLLRKDEQGRGKVVFYADAYEQQQVEQWATTGEA
jgi:hypothetical protein